MSQFIQHPASSIKLSFAARRAAWMVSLVLLAAIAATAVVLLVSNGSSSSSSATAQPVTQNTAPGVRYDGGPDEGTAGVQNSPALHEEGALGINADRPLHGGGSLPRYDGGPDEGTAGH